MAKSTDDYVAAMDELRSKYAARWPRPARPDEADRWLRDREDFTDVGVRAWLDGQVEMDFERTGEQAKAPGDAQGHEKAQIAQTGDEPPP